MDYLVLLKSGVPDNVSGAFGSPKHTTVMIVTLLLKYNFGFYIQRLEFKWFETRKAVICLLAEASLIFPVNVLLAGFYYNVPSVKAPQLKLQE